MGLLTRCSRVFSRLIALPLVSLVCALPVSAGQSEGGIRLEVMGSYSTGSFGSGAAEISAYDATTRRLFMINALSAKVDVINIADPTVPTLLFQIDVSAYGAGINSVAVHNGVVAVAVENAVKQNNGKVVFYSVNGDFLSQVEVGALPDMLTFTPDGTKVLVANEGEPNDAYTVDPEGSVSVIDVSRGAANVVQSDVRTAGFTAFNNATLEPSIRIFGPNASVAQDLEPEYITISPDSKTAWVTLQEGNAIGVIDIETATVTSLKGLGFKNHNLPGNGLDASDRDNGTNIRNWPVKGIYMPDAIASYTVGGQTYLVTANEGDSRDYSGFAEESRVSALTLDPTAFPSSSNFKNNANLGRLTVTKTLGDTDRDGDYDELYALGARSFSVWSTSASLIWDSGDQFEKRVAQELPSYFNSDNAGNNSFDTRSDNKGPEPEGVTIGQIGDSVYAFVGLERVGGVMVYNITNPAAPTFVQYINPRDFTASDPTKAGDLGPEGIFFIPRSQSPTKRDLVVVSNEVSGTVTIYQVMPQLTAASATKVKTYELRTTPSIGTYSGMAFYEGGASGLERVYGKADEFMIVTDRGPNVDATSNPLANGKTTIFFPFPNYAPKMLHVKAEGDSLRVLSMTTLKRPDGSNASGLPNPSNAGGTGEVAWSSTTGTVVAADAWGIDSEGLVEGNNNDYWLCEEYGATVWNIEKSTGRVINRYTPFGASPNNIAIPPVFSKRRPNRGFEGVAMTPSGKVYAIVQGPLYNPTSGVGNTSRLHRILEIDPVSNTTRMFAYEHDAAIGQIRGQDWKIGDLVAVNNNEFLVIEHAERNGWNFKNVYKINISNATPITSESFGGLTYEQLNDAAGAMNNGIVPVTKTLLLDLIESNWNPQHDKPEGIVILDNRTIGVINDNDYGITSPNLDGQIEPTGKTSSLYVYSLPADKQLNYVAPKRLMATNVDFGRTGQVKRITTTVRNTSNTESISATSAGITGNGAYSYRVYQPTTTTVPPITTTVATGATVSFDVVFGQQGISAAGRQNAIWTLSHTAKNPALKVEFTGYFASLTAQQDAANLLAPGAALKIGDVYVNGVGPSIQAFKNFSLAPDSTLPADAPIIVQSYSITGPDASSFSVGSGLSAGMPLSAAQNVVVQYSGIAATPGVKHATLVINHTAANGPSISIPLEARVGRSVLAAPTLVQLPSAQVGQGYTSAYDNVKLVPLAEGAFSNVTMTGVPSLAGVDASRMEIATNSGRYYIAGRFDGMGNVVVAGDGTLTNAANWLATPLTITPQQPVLVAVRMKQADAGTQVGTYNAELTLASSVISDAENALIATLVGEVVTDPNAAPNAIAFGDVPVGTWALRTLTLHSDNAGWATLTVPANNNFTFADGSKIQTVYVQEGSVPTNLEVKFAPATGGAQFASMAIAGVLNTTINISGNGQMPLLSLVEFTENSTLVSTLNFGSLGVGQTMTKTVTIRNSNAGPVTISTVFRSGSEATQYSAGMPSSMTIEGNGGTATLPVSFVPTSVTPSLKSAVVNVTFGNGIGTKSFGVSGNAATASQPGTIVLSPATWNFGTATSTKTFTITNNRTTSVSLAGVFISYGSANFSVVDASSTFPRTLAANGGSTTVTLHYTNTGSPAMGSAIFYIPGVSVYPTATLQGGNFSRSSAEQPVAGFSNLELQGNMPNPVETSTDVRFRLHQPASTVALRVYDRTGALVSALNAGTRAAGEHTITVDAADIAAGTYYYTVEADGEQQSGMMVIVK